MWKAQQIEEQIADLTRQIDYLSSVGHRAMHRGAGEMAKGMYAQADALIEERSRLRDMLAECE